VRRIFATWLAFSYLYASAAGAAGLGACVHAAHGEGGHASHAGPRHESGTGPIPPHVAHEEAHGPGDVDGHSPPATSGDATGGATDESGMGSTLPCDCLGDCSMGAGPAGAPSGETILVPGTRVELPANAGTRLSAAPITPYVLPFPNGPPLS
jgi:hypothetical protein